MKSHFISYLKNKTIRKAALFCGVLMFSTLIIIGLLSSSKPDRVGETKTEQKIRPVTVVGTAPASYTSEIVDYGEVVPEWEVSIQSQVQGNITALSDCFRVGERVKSGETLLQINPTQYNVLVAQAELALKQSEVDLLVEEKESQEAQSAWERSNLGEHPTSPLVLRKPYLEMARSNVSAAEAALIQARQQRDFTTIKAPFDAMIVSRNVSFGSEVFEGDPICTLVSTDKFVVSIQIDKKQFIHLPENWKGMAVSLIDTETGNLWDGKLARQAEHYDRDSRLRRLFVEIDSPFDREIPLLPWNFVEVRLKGNEVDGLLKVPESARDQKGRIWFVDKQNRLRSFERAPEFRKKGHLFVKSPKEEEMKIVVNPNDSFANGLHVTPSEKK
jgi:RND family efflux transporter MFP subunit